jgi:hypothetical protein
MGYEVDSKRGVANHYGVRTTNGEYGAQSQSVGLVKQAVWDFTYDKLPNGGTNNLQFVIPANATIKSATLYIDAAFTSTSTTTDLLVGLETSAGVSAGTLVLATEATQTAIAVAGDIITGGGTLVGSTVGANPVELYVTPSASDLLTGAGRVVVEYVYNS